MGGLLVLLSASLVLVGTQERTFRGWIWVIGDGELGPLGMFTT